jgi:hypothetical protein
MRIVDILPHPRFRFIEGLDIVIQEELLPLPEVTVFPGMIFHCPRKSLTAYFVTLPMRWGGMPLSEHQTWSPELSSGLFLSGLPTGPTNSASLVISSDVRAFLLESSDH